VTLLAALAPGGRAAAGASDTDTDDSVGALPLLAVAGKGIAMGVKQGLAWVKGPKGQKFLSKLKDSAKKRSTRLKFFTKKAQQAKTPESRKRWERRARRQQSRIDAVRQEAMLAERGIIGEGPVLEYRRNLLAMEWDSADTERRKQIEPLVKKMDARLQQLSREQKLLADMAKTGSAAAGEDGEGKGLLPRGPYALPEDARAAVNRALAFGSGGQRFTVQSPPGPGRLVRIPFYPLSDADSWTGAAGIDFPGDDPVVVLRIPPGARVSRPIMLRTEQFDYGTYRILGLQTNEQGAVRPATFPVVVPPAAFAVGNVVATLSRLSIYNGQTLFLQEGQVWTADYNIYPGSYTLSALGAGAMRAERPNTYKRRRSRWFEGFRDYPVVTGTTDVLVIIQAYVALPSPAPAGGPDYEYPVTVNLVGDMVEDEVYGDVVNPSPPSRPGAMVKVAARELGTSTEGRDQIDLVASHPRPRRR
jgi:hypothetical protein